jgi:hypothetical protein
MKANIKSTKGGKFMSEQARAEQIRQKKAKVRHHAWKRIAVFGALIGTDAALIWMIMTSRIDLMCGVLFVAMVSGLIGNQMK